MHRWDQLNARLDPLRERLLDHAVYACIADIEAVRTFMEHHIYAVWDFMSLLKALQQRLCCVTVPWLPPENPFAARLINEIVLAEETDVARDGSPASHFDLYLEAMCDVGADAGAIYCLFHQLEKGLPIGVALDACDPPAGVKEFVTQTFRVIETGDLPSIASAFTFGREDLLPGLFAKIIQQLNPQANGSLDSFIYYLDRHVALDGEHHGPMARKLMTQLCGDEPAAWQRAEDAAVCALESRMGLWNAMAAAIGSGPG
jgi:hypothetical protein